MYDILKYSCYVGFCNHKEILMALLGGVLSERKKYEKSYRKGNNIYCA